MIYSVFDYKTRRFKYYDGVAAPPAAGWFRRPNGGKVPEAIAAQVPPTAKLVGEGEAPRGFIGTLDPRLGATDGDGEGAIGVKTTLSWVGVVTILGVGLWLGRRTAGWWR